MSFTRLKKYDFAISQSISGSFSKGDTVEASFLSKANHVQVNSHTTQFVDLKYSVSSESIALKEFPKGTFPERFYNGISYVTKSFVAGIPEEIQYVQFTLTGSINSTGSHTYNSGGIAYADDLQLDYDAFQIKVHRPKTELKDSGLLVFTSPSKYIKADSDGVEIKGGQIQADKVTVETLEVFGDASIFGDVTATANSPYTSTPNLVGTSGSQGTVVTFARGDHQHALPFSTINTLAQTNEFTKISGSHSSTGSFGRLEVNVGGTANHTLTIQDVSTGIGHSDISSTGTLFLQQRSGNQIQFSGDVVPSSTGTKDLGSPTRQFQEFYAVSSSVSQSIVSGRVGIGTMNPKAELDVRGDISASGNLTLDSDGQIQFGLDNAEIKGSTNALDLIHRQTNYESGIRLQTQGHIYFANVHNNDLDFNTDTNMILSMSTADGTAKLGIGNINPTKTLTVAGDISASGDLNITNITSSGNLVFSGSDGNPSVAHRGVYFGTQTGQISYIRGQNAVGSQVEIGSDNLIAFMETDGDSEKIRFDMNSGKVGIGTTSPQNNDALLTVDGNISSSGNFHSPDFSSITGNLTASGNISSSGELFATDLTLNGSGINITADSATELLFSGGNIGNVASTGQLMLLAGSGADLSFGADNTNQKMILKSSGNVGIGTTSPSSPLHIKETKAAFSGTPSSQTSSILTLEHTITGDAENQKTFVDFVTIDTNANSTPQVRIGSEIGNDDGNADTQAEEGAGAFVVYTNEGTATANDESKLLERMRVNSVGKVGIGTTSPSTMLHISESTGDESEVLRIETDLDSTVQGPQLYIEGNKKGNSNTIATHIELKRNDDYRAAGIKITEANDTGEWFAGASYADKGFTIGYDATNNDAERHESSSLLINRSGNVGIGTINPQAPLEISSSANTLLKLKSTDSLAYLSFTTPTTDDDQSVRVGAAGNQLQLITGGSERMRILGDGKVGIGNTSPTKKLVVSGDISASGDIYLEKMQGINFSPTQTTFISSSDAPNGVDLTLRADDDIKLDADDEINIRTGGSDRIRVDSSGNLGIGTTSPDEKLEVVGNILTSGHITASGNISASGTIFASKFESAGTAGETIAFNDNLNVTGDITASGNVKIAGDISASGILRISQINDAGDEGASSDLTLAPQNLLNLGTSNVDEINIGRQSGNNVDINFYSDSTTPSLRIVERTVKFNHSITASADISASVDSTGSFGHGFFDSNVGIGTTTPITELEIHSANSEAYHYPLVLRNPYNNETNLDYGVGIKFHLDDASDNKFGSIAYEAQTSYANIGNLKFYVDQKDNTAPIATMTTTGLGIGTTSPTSTLTVVGDISASDGTRALQYDVSAHALKSSGATLDFNGTDFSFNTDDLFIDQSNSRVGIGTTSPGVPLEVHSGDTTQIVSDRDGNGTNVVLRRSGTDRLTFATSNTSGQEAQIFSNSGDLLLNYSSGQNVGIGINNPSEKLDVDGNIKTTGNLSSPNFFSGFAGSGFRVTSGSKYSLEVDDLTVRNSMAVFELMIHQVRATNGSLFISNTGKIISSSKTNNYSETHREFNLFFDTGSGYGHSFVVGDLIRAQRFKPDTNGSGSQVFKSDFHIIGVNGTTSSLARLTGSDEPEIGYEYVRIGSTTNTDRQGSIYMTADDENAPFLDVVDELTAHSQFNTAGKTKVRMGKLSGITTTTFGTLPGYGFYASGSAYLEGSINATSGKIAEFSIDSGSISSSNNNLKLFSDGVISGSDVHFRGGKVGGFTIDDEHISAGNLVLDSAANNGEIRLNASNLSTGNGVYANGAGSFRVGGESDNQLKFAGGVLSITTDALTLDSSGNLTTIGTISSSAGNIGGWTIDTDKLKKSNLFELAPNATYIISSSNFKVSSAGSIIATAGKIGGFGIAATTISSSTGTLILTNTGQITASDADITGKINATSGQFSGDVIATHINTDSGSIGGFTLDTNKISSTNLLLSSSAGASEVISASKFNVKADGQLTASNVLLNGGKIGGWEVTGFQLKSGGSSPNQNISLDATNKQITINSNVFGNPGVQLDYNGGNPQVHFGNAQAGIRFESGNNSLQITSSNVDISGSDVKIEAPRIFLGQGNSNFISASNSNIEISSSGFHLKRDGSAILSGSIEASQGTIGGFGLGSTIISSSTGELILKSTGQITASAVSMSGTIVTNDITATAGTIGGFTLDTNLKAGNDGAGGSAIDINPSTPSIKLGAKESIADNDGDTGAFLTDQAIAIGPQSATQGFRVTNQGVVTASNALIRGNSNIAGFEVTDSHISASGLLLKSGGQITASNVNLSGLISSSAGNIGGFKIEDDNISSTGLVINSLTGAGNDTPSIELGGKTVSLSTTDGIYIGKGTFFGSGHGIGIGDTNVLSATNGGGFIAASGDGDDDNNVVAFGHIHDAYSELKGNASYVMFRPTTGLILQHPNFSLRDGQLQISSSGDRPTSIKLSSDGATSGIEIDSKKGLIGHGDASGKILETHAGQFKFGEDTLSPDSNTDGVQYDSDGDVLNWGGSNFIVTNDGGGTT